MGVLPSSIRILEGARRYISAFRALLQELNNLNSKQVHTLQACSVLAIPPPMERMPPPGSFPKDLSELNLSGWAALIQDVVAGLWVVPPNLSLDVGLPAMVLLQLLEATTGVGFCHFCCHPSPWCKCMGAYQQAPTETWSQVVEQTSGCGVAASSGVHDPGSRNVLCLSAIFVCNINSSELHFQSVALRSQYSDHMPEAVTLH